MTTAQQIINGYKKEVITAIMLILLGACGSTVISNSTQEKAYDPYTDRMFNVDSAMQQMINNPSEASNDVAYDTIFRQIQWASRQTGERNDLFKEYLNECDNVRVGLVNGENVDLTRMNELKEEFK